MKSNKLQSELAEARQELEEEEQLRGRLTEILKKTADALHGGKLRNGGWSWHDLAELATRQRRALEGAMHALRSYQYGNAATELAEEAADECDRVLNERAQDTEPEGRSNAEQEGNPKAGR